MTASPSSPDAYRKGYLTGSDATGMCGYPSPPPDSPEIAEYARGFEDGCAFRAREDERMSWSF